MADFAKPRVAALSAQDLAKVQAAENQLGGVYLIAYEQPVSPAPLTPEQLDELQELETQLGVCLVAYRKNGG